MDFRPYLHAKKIPNCERRGGLLEGARQSPIARCCVEQHRKWAICMKRILVIEDAADIRGIIADTLKSNGWQPLLAEDGEQGVALANSQSPDLILCDIRMPKKDGYGVLQELRQTPGTAMVPFIFLSGLAE